MGWLLAKPFRRQNKGRNRAAITPNRQTRFGVGGPPYDGVACLAPVPAGGQSCCRPDDTVKAPSGCPQHAICPRVNDYGVRPGVPVCDLLGRETGPVKGAAPVDARRSWREYGPSHRLRAVTTRAGRIRAGRSSDRQRGTAHSGISLQRASLSSPRTKGVRRRCGLLTRLR